MKTKDPVRHSTIALFIALMVTAFATACGDDDGSTMEDGGSSDAGTDAQTRMDASSDAQSSMDANNTDGSNTDGSTTDGSTVADAGDGGTTPTLRNLSLDPGVADNCTTQDETDGDDGTNDIASCSLALNGTVSESSKWTSSGAQSDPWMMVDLGAVFTLSKFVVKHASAGGEPGWINTRAYAVEIGPTADGPWSGPYSDRLFRVGNGANALPDETTTTLQVPVAARYVRLHILRNVDNHARIPEFEIWGSEGPLSNVASGASCSTSDSSDDNTETNDISACGTALDGKLSDPPNDTKWTSSPTYPEPWMVVDLGSSRAVSQFTVFHASAGGEPSFLNTRVYRIESSDDGMDPWTEITTVGKLGEPLPSATSTRLKTPVNVRYIRLYIEDNVDNHSRIPEFQIWGR